jgi:hypothetical protein
MKPQSSISADRLLLSTSIPQGGRKLLAAIGREICYALPANQYQFAI